MVTTLKGYEFLAHVGPLPKMVREGLKTVGTLEYFGEADNPLILSWAKEVGLDLEYTADSTPWCGLWMAMVSNRAGYRPPAHPLWALNWQSFGVPAGQPALGDVLVFLRDGGGHVGLYIAEDQLAYHVLGGNTHDAVAIARIAKKRLRAARSPRYLIGRPESSKPYRLDSRGVLSTNEQ